MRVIINRKNCKMVKNDDGHFVWQEVEKLNIFSRVSQRLGIFILGLPFIDSVRKFRIDYSKIVPVKITSSPDMAAWIEPGEKNDLGELRTNVVLDYLVRGIHTRSGADIDIIVSIICNFVNPSIIVERLNGKLTLLSNTVTEAVSYILANLNIQDISQVLQYKRALLGDELVAELSDRNNIVSSTGVMIVDIVIPHIRVSDESLADALNSVQISKQKLIAAEFDAEAIKLTENAGIAEYTKIADILAANPGIARELAEIFKSERFFSGNKGGQNIIPVISSGSGKKRKGGK